MTLPTPDPRDGSERTSIGFGDGEVVVAYESVAEMSKMVAKAIRRHALIEVEQANGEIVVINPSQIKILQPLPAAPLTPEPGEAYVRELESRLEQAAKNFESWARQVERERQGVSFGPTEPNLLEGLRIDAQTARSALATREDTD